MAIAIGGGIEIGPGVTMTQGFAPSISAVYDLDAANFTGVPGVQGGSAQFSSTNYLTIPANAAFTFGTSDHTIEFWMYQTSRGAYDTPWAYSRTASATATNYYLLDVGSSEFKLFLGNGAAGYAVNLNCGTAPSLNVWHHYAIVRSGTTFTVYADGTSVGTATSSQSIPAQVNPMSVGGGHSNGGITGYITNLRVVNGTAVYTSNFTPPTSPLIPITNTKLLLTESNSSGLLTDSSTNSFTVTNVGTVAYNSSTPFAAQATTDATNNYTLTVNNAGSIYWTNANGGIFVKTNSVGTDVIYGGPNYVTGQSYTVFMAYALTATSAGRLLNTQSEASKDWLMGAYNGNPNTFYPNGSVNLPSTGADTVWHFGWATLNTSTSVGQLWIATNTQPTTFAYTATNASFGGFNQLRMFSRAAGTEVQSGSIGFVKVYNGVLTTADIQGLYNQYKSRFGY